MTTAAHAAGHLDAHDHDEEHPPPVVWSSAMPTGLMGLLFFIGSEIALFGSFFMAYFFVRVVGDADYSSWAQTMGEAVPLDVATINSIILFSSSVTIHWAEIALRRGARGYQALWVFLTLVLGSIFLGVQVVEYATLVGHEQIGPSNNAYSSVFFSLTGLHGSHVLVGIILLAVMVARTLRGHYSPHAEQHVGFRAMAIYWHFVDLVWVFVFSLIYLPGNLGGWRETTLLGMSGPVFMAVGVALLFFLALGVPKIIGKEAPKH